MIPVSFVAGPGGTVRYPPETAAMLRAMKDATIAQARAVMARATTEEGLTVAQAVQKYHHGLDLIARQYALLGETEQPRCLGQMAHTIGGQRFSVQPGVVAAYVETFVRLLDLVEITQLPGSPDEEITDPRERTFHIPDMNCKHCRATITALLESMEASRRGDRPGDQARRRGLPDRGGRGNMPSTPSGTPATRSSPR